MSHDDRDPSAVAAAPLAPGGGLEVHALYRGLTIGARYLPPAGSAPYLIGIGARTDAPVAQKFLEDSAPYCLVARDDRGGFVVNVTAAMTGEVLLPGGTVPLGRWVTEHGSAFTIPDGATVAVACGEMTFVLRGGAAAPPGVRARPLVWRWRRDGYSLGAVLGFLLVLLLVSVVPPDARALSLDDLGRHHRLADYRVIPVREPPPPPGASGGSGPELPAAGGAPAAFRTTGTGGRPRPGPPAGARATVTSRDGAAAAARRAGILGAFPAVEGSVLDTIFTHRTALGESVLADLTAVEIAGAYGPIGTGFGGIPIDHGPGGGPLLGVGRLGTIGDRGGGPRGGPRYGADQAGLSPRQPGVPGVIPGIVTARGSLDREIIRRVVRRHINEVRHCYERELVRQHDLQGRVAVQFTIGPNGLVAAAALESSSLGNPRVEVCVLQAVRRWAFPTPAGGGVVVAIYPFNFAVAGGTR